MLRDNNLRANGPAWHDRFPNLEFDIAPDDFATKDQCADYFEAYVKKFDMPVRTGVEVNKVERKAGQQGFIVETSESTIEAKHIVAATGAFQTPVIPPIAPSDDSLLQIHSAAYRNPDQLPEGAVMVIRAGSSGSQIADELRRSGREVYLSVGVDLRLFGASGMTLNI